jgi:hypothetical protein
MNVQIFCLLVMHWDVDTDDIPDRWAVFVYELICNFRFLDEIRNSHDFVFYHFLRCDDREWVLCFKDCIALARPKGLDLISEAASLPRPRCWA